MICHIGPVILLPGGVDDSATVDRDPDRARAWVRSIVILGNVADDTVNEFELRTVPVVENHVVNGIPFRGWPGWPRWPRGGQVPYEAGERRPAHNNLIQKSMAGKSLYQASARFGVIQFRVEVWVVIVGNSVDPIDQTIHVVAVVVGIDTHQTSISAVDQEVLPLIIACELRIALVACIIDGVPDAADQRLLSQAIVLLIWEVWKWAIKPASSWRNLWRERSRRQGNLLLISDLRTQNMAWSLARQGWV